MKAIQLSSIKKIDVIDIKKPYIKNDNDVLIKVKKVGICGSDVHYYKTGKIGNQIVKYPFIIGHEMSGIVEKIGLKVSKVKVNDRIAVDPLIYCNTCDQCKIGRYHTCRNQKFLGCPGQMEGCLKEYIVLPETCCYPIPANMTYDNAVLCEPLSIGFYATSFAGDNLNNKKIAILGCGPIGLSVLLISKMLKAEKIYATDLLMYRLKTAHEQGAHWTAYPQAFDKIQKKLQSENNQLDFVFECCGKQEAINRGLKILKPGGKLIIIGIPEFENFSFDAHLMRRNEITIHNVRRQNEYLDKTISCVNKKMIDPGFMITHNYSISQALKAFEKVSNYKDKIIKAVINFE